jgi:ferritin-like metal-binding protein YciE
MLGFPTDLEQYEMANIDTLDLWQKWMGAVQAIALPGGISDKQQFSAGSTTLNIDLGNSNPNIQNYYIHGLGDVVPADSPSYSAGSGLLSAYATFLDWIDPGAALNPNLASQVSVATTNLNTAQTTFNNVQAQAFTAYTNAKNIFPNIPAFQDWVGQGYQSYPAANNALIGAANTYEELMIQMYGPGYSVLQTARTKAGINGAQSLMGPNAFNMAITSGTVSPPGSQPVVIGGVTPPPTTALVSSLAPSYTLQAFGTKYAEWQAASVAGKTNAGASIAITSGTASYSLDKSGWSTSANASLFGDFFSFSLGGSASGQKTSIDTTSSDFSLQVDFTGFGSFPISPGPWWDSALVALNSKKLKPGAPVFFGEGGALSAIATQVVVGFEPTVTLKMSASDYSNVKSSWEASATTSIGIGPFRLGSLTGSANGTKQDIKYDDATASVTIGPISSTLPVLLGVISQKLGV